MQEPRRPIEAFYRRDGHRARSPVPKLKRDGESRSLPVVHIDPLQSPPVTDDGTSRHVPGRADKRRVLTGHTLNAAPAATGEERRKDNARERRTKGHRPQYVIA
jgi:hypothetical protein